MSAAVATVDVDDTQAQAVADRLCAAWGWAPGEPEAMQLARNIVAAAPQLVAGTATRSDTLLHALTSTHA